MKLRAYSAIVVVASLSLSACVETPSAQPNSDFGHLFVDVEEAFAVDWEANILVRGPATGGTVCDDMQCMPAHRVVDVEEVASVDPEVAEVTGFETVSFGEVQFLSVELDVVGAGEATIELAFTVEGYDPEDAERDDEDRLIDSFGIEAREVASIDLSRVVSSDDKSPYRSCPATGSGIHLLDDLSSQKTLLRLEKRDDEGELLRGSGNFPFDIEPEEAAAVEDYDEARGLITVEPRQWGDVVLQPHTDGSALQMRYARFSEVISTDTRLYAIDQLGGRMGEVTELVVDYVYEVETRPNLPADQALCQGAGAVRVETLTPAICDVVGWLETTGNPAVVGFYGGECHLEVELFSPGGTSAVVENWAYLVVY